MNNNFLFFGDSLIAGYGVNKEDCWVNNLSDNINIINSGVNGNTTADMLYRVSNDIRKSSPHYVFLMAGTNDLLLNRSLTYIIDNMSLLIKEFKDNNCKIQLGIPPYIVADMAKRLFMPSMNYDYAKLKLPEYRDMLIDLCNNEEISYIDFYTLTKENLNEDIYVDGIHLNKKGHKLMADYWTNFNKF